MVDAILLALSPFVLNGVTAVANWGMGITDTAGKRLVLALLSLIGVVATAAMTGQPIDPTNVSTLLTAIATSFLAFLMAHGSYHLFFKGSPAPQPATPVPQAPTV